MTERIIELLADHLGMDVSEINENTTFEDLGADSLDVVEILMEMEDEFDVKIEAEKAGKTVADLAGYIASVKE